MTSTCFSVNKKEIFLSRNTHCRSTDYFRLGIGTANSVGKNTQSILTTFVNTAAGYVLKHVVKTQWIVINIVVETRFD